MQRVAIIGEGPAALSAVERLLSAGMCVDLISEKLHRSVYFAALRGLPAWLMRPCRTSVHRALPRGCAYWETCAWE